MSPRRKQKDLAPKPVLAPQTEPTFREWLLSKLYLYSGFGLALLVVPIVRYEFLRHGFSKKDVDGGVIILTIFIILLPQFLALAVCALLLGNVFPHPRTHDNCPMCGYPLQPRVVQCPKCATNLSDWDRRHDRRHPNS